MSDPSASTSAEQASKTQSPPPVAIFKKKGRTRPAAARQRSPSPSSTSTSTPTGPGASSSEPSGSAVSRPSKKAVYNPLIQGTKRKTRLEDDTLEDWADDGVDVNWKSSGKNKADNTNYVTESLDWDADALEEKENAKRAKLVEAALNDGIPDDGMYHGAAAYKTHLEKRVDGPSNKMKAGPQKASSNIRQITIVDYQPDVCKDYKETGWCGFGDTCKFLHDRGDYLSGWQLDKQHAEDLAAGKGGDSSEEEEEIPFACLICRKDFVDPVVTKCGHYFDSACAIKRFAKTPKCFACGTATGGIFNSATQVLKKLEQKKRQREAAREERDGKKDDSDDGGGEDDDDGGLHIASDSGEE